MNREKLSHTLSLLLIVSFAAFLCCAMVITLTSEKDTYSYYENRNLAQMPQASREGMLDGSYFSGVDTYLTDHAAARNAVIKLLTFADLHILHRPVVNETVILEDLLLPYNEYKPLDEEGIQSDAQLTARKLKTYADCTADYGGVFYYVAVPCQYVCYQDSYPWYLDNRAEYTALSSAALFQELDRLGVNRIDMLEFYEAQGKPAWYSSTIDNHYGIEGAYATYREILNRVLEDTSLMPDVLEEEEFTLTTLENPYLGSRPRKLLGLWDTQERLSILTPKEDIPFARWDNGVQVPSQVYHAPAESWQEVPYNLYMTGDVGETIIKTYRNQLPSILIYGDSFTNAVESIAWTGFNAMYSLDFRYYTGCSLTEYIQRYQPDIVVCIRDYEALLGQKGNGQ